MKPLPLRLSALLSAAMIAIFAALVLGGCESSQFGTRIDPAKVAQIKKGVTTRDQIEELFGPPMNVSLMPDGRRTMYYTYSQVNAHASAASYIPVVGFVVGKAEGTNVTQTLQIIISAKGVVDDYEFSNGASQIGGGMWGTNTKPMPAPTSVTSKS